MTTFTRFSSSSSPPSSPSPPSHLTSIFLQSDLFCLLIAVTEGYCCSWLHSSTHKHSFNMTTLDEGSACRKGLYMFNAQHSQETDIHVPGGIHTRSPSVDLRLTLPATGIGHVQIYRSKFWPLCFHVSLFRSCTLPDCFVLYDGTGKDHFYALRVCNRKSWISVIILSPAKKSFTTATMHVSLGSASSAFLINIIPSCFVKVSFKVLSSLLRTYQ